LIASQTDDLSITSRTF